MICGDVNTAHQEIDLARLLKENRNISGFLDIEREWVSKVLDAGFIDTFRYFHPDEKKVQLVVISFSCAQQKCRMAIGLFFCRSSYETATGGSGNS